MVWGDLISIKPTRLARRIDREAYNEFERFCINLVRDADKIARAMAEAKSTCIPEKALALVSESLDALQRRGISKASLQERRERFRELSKAEPEFAKDESGRLGRDAVGVELTMLLGSFPTSNVPEFGSVFSESLLEDVLNADYDFLLSIYGGCREIRRTQKFMPSVSEVLEFIAEKNAFWLSAFNASESIVENFAELIELRDEMPEKIKGKRE